MVEVHGSMMIMASDPEMVKASDSKTVLTTLLTQTHLQQQGLHIRMAFVENSILSCYRRNVCFTSYDPV